MRLCEFTFMFVCCGKYLLHMYDNANLSGCIHVRKITHILSIIRPESLEKEKGEIEKENNNNENILFFAKHFGCVDDVVIGPTIPVRF